MSLMPQTPFQWFIPATTGTGMVPAAGYLVKYYAAGTTTPKDIYIDVDLGTPYPSPSNTAVLDANGRALIYLGAGGYKMVVCMPDGTPVYTQDNISGESSFGTGFAASYASLADVNSTLNGYTYIAGYYTPGDGGEGMFYNKESSDAADGGYIQVANDNNLKRWFRIPDENGDVRAASFGYCGSGELTSNLLAADAYAYGIGARLRIQKDVCTSGAITLTAPTVAFNQNAALYANGAGTLTILGNVEAGGWDLFSSWTTVNLQYSRQESRPEWFGASLSNSDAANVTAFDKWKAANAGIFIVPPDLWPYTGTFVPESSRVTIFLGEVGGRISGTYYGPANLLSGNLSLTLTGTFGLTGNLTLTGNITGTGNITRTGTFTLSGAAQVGALISDDNVAAATDITAGSTITAGNAVIAGGNPSLPGYVQARAGTSGRAYKAAGSGNIVLGAGDATLEEGALVLGGDYIKIICAGTTDVAAPVITVTVGGRTVFTATLAIGSGSATHSYHVEVLLFRTGTTTGFSTGFVNYSAVSGGIFAQADSKTLTGGTSITWANANTVAHTISSSGTKTLTMYEIYPAS